MCSRYEYFKDFVKIDVNYAYKEYTEGNTDIFAALLRGTRRCEPVPEFGHRADIVVEVMHEYNVEKPEYEEIFKEAFGKLIEDSRNFSKLENLLDILSLELSIEGSEKNSFSIDKEETLQRLGKLIKDNYDTYKDINPFFDDWICNERKRFINVYAVDILSRVPADLLKHIESKWYNNI